MLKNIWLYGFDGFNGVKTIGFVIANSEEDAGYSVRKMYDDYSEHNLDDLIVWKPENDDNYREDYSDVMEIVY